MQPGEDSGVAFDAFRRQPEGANQQMGCCEVGHPSHHDNEEEDGQSPVPARAKCHVIGIGASSAPEALRRANNPRERTFFPPVPC